jgi:hypothetical protein
MAFQASRSVTLDYLEDGDEIEVEAAEDASKVEIRKGKHMFTLTPDEFSELVYAFLCVDRYIERVAQRRRAN